MKAKEIDSYAENIFLKYFENWKNLESSIFR